MVYVVLTFAFFGCIIVHNNIYNLGPPHPMSFSATLLKDIILTYIPVDPPTGTGWQPVLCKVCGDRGHKGKRAAFRFEGDKVAYHCFNCGHAAVYDPEQTGREGQPLISPKMITVLRDFGIPDDEWQQVLFSAMANRDAGNSNNSQQIQKVQSIEPPEIPLPESFYLLQDATDDDKWAEIARHYLEVDRRVDPSSYPFMLSKRPDDPRLNKWIGRVIIPIYKNNKLIFYIGRDLTGKAKKKYESPPVSRERVLYGFDRLYEKTDLPLYIVEGWFDANSVDGVALLGNEISDAQAEWLNRSHRKKVYIPDRFGDGMLGAERALKLGWHISTPDIGGCKDIDEAVIKYGKLYVMKTIVENTASGFEARTKLGVYCK